MARTGTATYAAAIDVQATSNEVTLTRAAWSLGLTTNKAVFATGETVTLSSASNQSPSYTGGYFRHYLFNKTTGALLANCSTAACSYASNNLIVSGAHDFVSVVAKFGATNYSNLVDIQAESNIVPVSRLTWTLTLNTSATEFVGGGHVTISAVPNQSLSGSGFRTYIFDLTAGTKIGECYTGWTCSTTSSFTTGGPHTYIAVVAPTGTYANYAAVTARQATSNEVTVSRMAWTVTLSASNPVFATGAHPGISASLNQTLSGSAYQVYIFDTTGGTRIGVCYTGWSCSGWGDFLTSGPHEYIAVVRFFDGPQQLVPLRQQLQLVLGHPERQIDDLHIPDVHRVAQAGDDGFDFARTLRAEDVGREERRLRG